MPSHRLPALRAGSVTRVLTLIGECLVVFFLVFGFFVALTATK